jgi:hypothetical protein
MKNRFLPGLPAFLVLVCLAITVPAAARERVYGYVERGGQRVVTAGLQSSTFVQRSYPLATVTVYLTGTNTLASIYADNSGTVKPNPFSSDATGFWFFYADDGTYDVRFSGGGLAAPFTLPEIVAGGSGGGGSGPYVLKAGDTMTGDLTLYRNTPGQWPALVLNNDQAGQTGIINFQRQGTTLWNQFMWDDDFYINADTTGKAPLTLHPTGRVTVGGAIGFTADNAAPVSASGAGSLRYNSSAQRFETSSNGGAWTALDGGDCVDCVHKAGAETVTGRKTFTEAGGLQVGTTAVSDTLTVFGSTSTDAPYLGVGSNFHHPIGASPKVALFTAGGPSGAYNDPGPAVAILARSGPDSGTYGLGSALLLDGVYETDAGETTTLSVLARQAPGSTASMAGIYTRVYAVGAPGLGFWGEQTSFGQAIDIQKYHRSHASGMEINTYNGSGEDSSQRYHDAPAQNNPDNITVPLALIPSANDNLNRKTTTHLYLGGQGGHNTSSFRGIDFGTNAVVAGGYVSYISMTNPGAGCSSAPTIAITGGGCVASSSGGINTPCAAAVATISGGAVNTAKIVRTGQSFTSTPTVTFSGGGCSVNPTGVAVMERGVAIDTTRLGGGASGLEVEALRMKTGQQLTWTNNSGGYNKLFANSGDGFFKLDGSFYIYNGDSPSGITMRSPTGEIEATRFQIIPNADGQPVCNSTTRGTLWMTNGGAGVKDAVQVCAKDATDTYAWRTLY